MDELLSLAAFSIGIVVGGGVFVVWCCESVPKWVEQKKQKREKQLQDAEQEKCYAVFSQQFPNTQLCPGKDEVGKLYISPLCEHCKHYRGSYKYRTDQLSSNDFKILSFESKGDKDD